MKKYFYTIIAVFIAALIFSVIYMFGRNQYLKKDRDVYKSNSTTLLDSVKFYTTKDSLNAATIGNLQLTNKEYKFYRATDLALIKSLQTKNRDLENVTTTQTKTINYLRGNIKDSIVYVPIPGKPEYRTDTLKCINIVEPWFELKGCSNKSGEFNGIHINRDSLLIAVTVKRKRFLGFLWKTNKVKDRKVDVVSKNPATQINGVEYIEIRK